MLQDADLFGVEAVEAADGLDAGSRGPWWHIVK